MDGTRGGSPWLTAVALAVALGALWGVHAWFDGSAENHLTSVEKHALPAIEAKDAAAAGTVREALAGVRSERAWDAGVQGAGAIGCVLLVLLLTRRAVAQGTDHLREALRESELVAARLAQGDLTVRAASTSQTEVAFASTVARLRGTIQETQAAVGDLELAADAILGSLRASLGASQSEATAVQETTTTASELQQTVHVTERQARAVQEVMERTVEATQAIRSQLDASAGSMDRMRAQMQAIVGSVEALQQRNARIGEIIESVREVAGQTHLLAVNAGIESAKAGDVGRGFGVVASEMKTLADQSRKAAENIRAIVADTQLAAAETSRVIAESEARLQDAMTPIAEVLPLVEQLIALVEESNGSLRQILAVVGQQVAGIDQISQAMRTVHQAVQDGLARNEDLAEGADGLGKIGRRLKSAVGGYRL